MTTFNKNKGIFKSLNRISKKKFTSAPGKSIDVKPIEVKPIDMSFQLNKPPADGNEKLGVLVMHGLLGSRRNWLSFSKKLSTSVGLKVYNLDARNHGDSPHTPEHSAVHIAEDIAHFVQKQKLESVYTVGHSMGGRGMMYFALKYPHLVPKSIIVDISPISSPPNVGSMTKIFKAMKSVNMISSDKTLSQGRAQMKQSLVNELGAKYADSLDFILMNLRKNKDTGEFSWAPNIDALLVNMPDFGKFLPLVKELPPYKGDIMFVCGKNSDFFKVEDWPEVLKLFPSAQVKWLEAGHLVHIEKPKEMLNISRKFLL